MKTGNFRVVLILIAVLGQASLGQNARVRQNTRERVVGSDKSVIRVFRLETADVNDVVVVLQNLGIRADIVANEGTNSIIVRGTEVSMKQVQELIGELDQYVSRDSSESAFIKLRHRSAREAAEMMRKAVLHSQNARLAIDEANQMVVVSASEEELESAKRLVAQMDKARETLSMEFFFIRGKVNHGQGDPGTLPARLQDVKAALNEQGISELKLMALLSVQARAGSGFGISGSGIFEADASKTFTIQGDVLEASKEGSARLRVEANVKVLGQKGGRGFFWIETTLVTEMGEHMVLAAAPGTSEIDEVIALVIYAE